jgi:hypothetical protein
MPIRINFKPTDFIGTAKGYNTPRLASKLKICFRPMPRGPAFVGRQACNKAVYYMGITYDL